MSKIKKQPNPTFAKSLHFDHQALEFDLLWQRHKQTNLVLLSIWFLRFEMLRLWAIQIPYFCCKLMETYLLFWIFSCLDSRIYEIFLLVFGVVSCNTCECFLKVFQEKISCDITTKYSSVLSLLLYHKFTDSCTHAFKQAGEIETITSEIFSMTSVLLPSTFGWCTYFMGIFFAPIQVAFYSYLLLKIIFPQTLICCFIVIALTFLVQIFLVWFSVRLGNQAVDKFSNLNSFWSNVLEGIQVIKYNCWESYFKKKVRLFFDVFFARIKLHTIAMCIMMGIFLSCSGIVVPITIIYKKGKDYGEKEIFVLSLLISLLFTFFFQMTQASLAIRKFATVAHKYGQLVEKIEANMRGKSGISPPENEENAIEIGTASKVRISRDFSLNIGQFSIKKGQKIAVCGPLRGGKSSFLFTINGFFTCETTGGIRSLKTALCPQLLWLVDGSVRENILMGREYDEERYKTVLQVCALEKDLESWNGDYDDKQVGERGAALSGGQKARVCLARTLYDFEAEVFLLDDVFSPLDFETQDFIISQLRQPMFSEKTFLISINNIKLKSYFSSFIEVKEGNVSLIEDFDGYEGLIEFKQPELMENLSTEYLMESAYYSEEEDEEQEEWMPKETQKTVSSNQISSVSSTFLQSSEKKKTSIRKFKSTFLAFLMTEKWYSCFLLLGILISIGTYIFLYNQQLLLNDAYSKGNMLLFCFLWTCHTLMAVSKCFFLFVFIRYTAKALYCHCIDRILETHTWYFFRTPISHILTILTNDILKIFDSMPLVLIEFVEHFAVACVALIFASFKCYLLIAPSIFLVIVAIFVLMYRIRDFSPHKHEQIKQLDAFLKQLNATKNGAAVIHSLGIQKDFKEKGLECLQRQEIAYSKQRRNFLNYTALCIIFSAVYVYLSCFFYIKKFQEIDANRVSKCVKSFGKFLILMLNLSKALERISSTIIHFKSNLVFVKRILTLQSLEPEDETMENHCLSPNWPENGEIVLKNVSSYFSDQPSKKLIDSLSLHIKAGEKVALCGRTGAGKSSLLNLILRVIPITSGSILIDNVDISQVPICILRQKLAFVPQEPYVFCVSIRENLDPLHLYDEEQLWSALSIVGMQDLIKEFPMKLDQQEYKFSHGDMQLLSLARALLKKPKILFLDEFTSKLDLKATSKVLEICYSKLSGCTVISIAHNLESIMKLDKIAVLRDGKLEEFDSPSVLLQNKGSILSKFAAQHL